MTDTEQRLLDAIRAGDDASRIVYADWLDENGRTVHAEFVRLQLTASQLTRTHAELDATTTRLRELARSLDAAWRMAVARPIIEGCAEATCPREWGSLAPSPQPTLRQCRTCTHDVQYCVAERELLDRAARSARYVADVALVRTSAVCMRCGKVNQTIYKFCLGCGATVQPHGTLFDAPASSRHCGSCGHANQPQHRFCTTCGTQLG